MSIDLNLGETPLILDQCQRYGLLRNQAAYVLATAYWENARTMEPVREAFWVKNAEEWRRKNLRYYPWYGRGFVQLTWERNYVAIGTRLGLDLTTDPDVVMRPDLSAQILVTGMMEGLFTGKKLTDYVTVSASNYRGARRVVNGTDKASAIAELAEDYEAKLLQVGYGVERPAPVVNERKDGTPPRTSPARSTTNLSVAGGSIAMVSQLSDRAMDIVGKATEGLGVSPEFAVTALGLLFMAWIFRERLRKWARGDR